MWAGIKKKRRLITKSIFPHWWITMNFGRFWSKSKIVWQTTIENGYISSSARTYHEQFVTIPPWVVPSAWWNLFSIKTKSMIKISHFSSRHSTTSDAQMQRTYYEVNLGGKECASFHLSNRFRTHAARAIVRIRSIGTELTDDHAKYRWTARILWGRG